MKNIVIYLIIIYVVGAILFLYNKKQNRFLLILCNLIIFILLLASLVIFTELNLSLLLIFLVLVFNLGMNIINYIVYKRVKKYFLYNIFFIFLTSVFLFFIAFITLIIGILCDISGI